MYDCSYTRFRYLDSNKNKIKIGNACTIARTCISVGNNGKKKQKKETHVRLLVRAFRVVTWQPTPGGGVSKRAGGGREGVVVVNNGWW